MKIIRWGYSPVTDLVYSFIEQVLPTPRDVHMATFLCEEFCCCQADAIAAAGNNHDLVFKALRHLITFKEKLEGSSTFNMEISST